MNGLYILYGLSGLFIFIAIIIALVAEVKVYNSYNQFSKIKSSLNMTGAQLAQNLSLKSGLNLKVNMCKGKLSDHYNPKDKSINISQENYSSDSIASLSIVAHEFGHALQDAEGYKLLKFRQFAIGVSNFASKMLMPLVIFSLILSIFIGFFGTVMLFTFVAIYGLAVLVNLVTLPVEINASARAKELLFAEISNPEEQVCVEKMLSAAAMTYLASLLVSVAYFLRFFIMMLMFINNRD